MNFLVPAFFGAAALVGLPFLLHLLRLQPRTRVPFPSLRFLGRDALRDSNRHRLRRWLAFLLRCLAILLIVGAFCRPFWRLEHSEESRAVVVVVDNSFSMQAAGRRAAVEAWLSPQLAALRRPDQLGVLVLHPSPAWLVPLGDDLDAGREAVKTLPQSYEISSYRAGLELAAAKLALAPLKRKLILLAGDEQRLGWSSVRFERTLPPGVQLFPAPPAPAPGRQAAIVQLKAARTSDGRIAFDAAVRGFTAGADERTVTFFAGGAKLGVERTVLSAGRTQNVHAEFPVPDITSALMLHATIDPDDLPADDIAYAALAAADDRRVMLAPGRGGTEVDFLATALSAARGAKGLAGFRVDPLPATGAAWAPSSVAVLRGAAPFRADATQALEAFLAAGGSALVWCDGSPEQVAWLAQHEVTVAPARPPAGARLKLRDLALEHPLFAPFAGHSIAPLLTPVFHRGWSLDGPSVEPLARWPDRTVAIAEVPAGAGRLLIAGFGETRVDSTFPLEAGYVPLVHQAVNWLGQSQMAAPIGCRVNATLVLPGAGTWRAVLTPKPVASAEVNGVVVPSVPGLYAFEQPDMPKRYYAVNLDPAESDLTPWPTPQDFLRLNSKEAAPEVTPPAASANGAQAVIDELLVDERQTWWWLIVAAIALLFLELALANRTIP
jgi:hypothetical protein